MRGCCFYVLENCFAKIYDISGKCIELSGGQKQRVAIALAIVMEVARKCDRKTPPKPL